MGAARLVGPCKRIWPHTHPDSNTCTSTPHHTFDCYPCRRPSLSPCHRRNRPASPNDGTRAAQNFASRYVTTTVPMPSTTAHTTPWFETTPTPTPWGTLSSWCDSMLLASRAHAADRMQPPSEPCRLVVWDLRSDRRFSLGACRRPILAASAAVMVLRPSRTAC